MANRYAPLPNPRSDRDAEEEMEAAFDDSDDESQPLNPSHQPTPTHQRSLSLHNNSQQPREPGTYDFENVDYDYPPPGSPPPPSAVALPNSFGNSNGLIPSFNPSQWPRSRPGGWLNRVLPERIAQRFQQAPPQGVVGGGTGNDGVFANVTAKPTRPIRIQDGDESYVVPEDARAEAPPSYATAQADAVPPYWETTVHAPFSPDAMGEMIVDSLPTGSVFSFLWNMLVSVSFQFVGFLLTYLLHTTHAARLGSRAGLGITLIQYGFALRSHMDGNYDEGEATNVWGDWRHPQPTDGVPSTAAEADAMYNGPFGFGNSSTAVSPPDVLTDEQASILIADATTEWLAFFLMTVGWFILLTSLLGFWRVKRWERGIIASQRNNNPTPAASEGQGEDGRPISQFHRIFGLRGAFANTNFVRQGFGLGPSRDLDGDEDLSRAEEGTRTINLDDDVDEHAVMLSIPEDAPDRERRIQEAIENERRLQRDLRAAGLL